MSIKNIYLLTLILFSFSSYAQILEPVKWTFTEEHLGGDEYMLSFKATIDDEWTVYSQWTSDDGPVPTSINYETADVVELVGKNEEVGHRKEGFDKLFEVNVIKFLGDQDFVIKQKVKKKGSGPLTGYLTFMTCNDKTCLPPTDVDFSFPLSGSASSETKKKNKATGSVPDAELAPAPEIDVVENTNEAPVTNTESPKYQVELDEEPITEESPSTEMKVNPIVVNTGSPADQPSSEGILEPVKWSWDITPNDDGTYTASYTAKVDKGWTVYSQFTDDNGPQPTTITYETPDVEVLGKGEELGHRKEGPDKLFDNVVVIKYLADKPFIINQKIKVKDGVDKLSGYLTFMTCNDITCLPPTDVEFSHNLGAVSSSSTPMANTIVGDKVDQRREKILASFENPSASCGDNSGTNKKKSTWWLLLAGILGGFAALMTPCVFPMIPITVSFFTKDTKRKGWMNGLIYALSIIVIYVILGLLITVLVGPEALNALATNWIANVLFFIIFMVFAFSFFGYYEITLPTSWTTKTDSMADKGGLLGIFFMATTLALVSFSCTGPIVGSALVAAANGGLVGPLVVMLGFSAALALPFGLFAAFPAWLNSLPKSGSWMNSVKVVLGFLEVAFAFKFLSTADLTEHWGFLRYELFMLILIVVSFLIAIYLFGFIKFPHDSPLKKLSMTRRGIATAFTILGIYLCFGFTTNKDTGIYNSLWLTSGFSPPVNYNFLLAKAKADESISSKYSSFTKCANNIDCFKDYFEGMAYAKQVGKPAFVDFTGHGCQNCRRTEDNIWVDNEVRKILNDEVVLISLYVDDRKKLPKPFVSLADGKKKRTVGAKWADFQVNNFKQNSQPLYVMMTPEEQVISTPRGYEEGIDEYLDYLNCGLSWFKKNAR